MGPGPGAGGPWGVRRTYNITNRRNYIISSKPTRTVPPPTTRAPHTLCNCYPRLRPGSRCRGRSTSAVNGI
eukprot:5807356-Prymnesium_polylepis.1